MQVFKVYIYRWIAFISHVFCKIVDIMIKKLSGSFLKSSPIEKLLDEKKVLENRRSRKKRSVKIYLLESTRT